MCHDIEEGHDEVDARPQHGAQTAKAFDHMLFRLGHDLDAFVERYDYQNSNRQPNGIATQKIMMVP